MALGIRYSGSFLSQRGVTWRVDILQEGYGGTQPGELIFPADTPLEISWGATDKLTPVQCSSATLKIISDTDRRFIDLYTVEVGAVRMDVYRNGSLYWSGSLDTELYEEPYSTADGYDVSLTFSDFACLERLDWSGSGLITVRALVDSCLAQSGINYRSLDVSYISTEVNYSKMTLQEVYVLQENFFDEDGEARSAKEVLEETLRPFALRIIQKAGKVWIYDLNGLHSKTPSRVEWDSTDSVLSADKIFNNVKVTFSPYADAEMMKGTVERNPAQNDAVKSSDLNTHDLQATVLQNYERNSYGGLVALEGFKLFYDNKETHKSNMEVSGDARFFQIASIHSGQDETGVLATFKKGDYAVAEEDGASSKVRHQLLTPKDCGTISQGNVSSTLLITCPKAYLGYVSYLRMDYKLRINLNLLFDVRYNPFEQEGDYNDNAKWYNGLFNWSSHDGPYQNMQDWCNQGYVPIKLTLVDDAGNALYHYENRRVLESDGYDHSGKTSWKPGAASWGDAYLCYYDFDDRKSKTGFGGWKTNKQIIGYYRDGLPDKWKTIDDGEYVDLPPVGGYLLLEIGSGIHQFDYKREVKNIYKFCRWIAYKEPSITLCRKNYKEAETEDIEDTAWLNRAAKEELTIDTIVGTITSRHGVPNAKGQIFNSNHEAFDGDDFRRAGIKDRLERLLIGTVYSQYASRHDTLSGTVVLLDSFGIYGDANTPGKFILLSESQNCIEDTSEINMAEFSEDNYEGIEYE